MSMVEQAFSEITRKYNVQRNVELPGDISFYVSGVADEDEALSAARAAVGSTIPSRVGFYALKQLQVAKRTGTTDYVVEAVYDDEESGGDYTNERPKPTYSFTTKGYNEHVNFAELIAKYPETAKDYGQAIDVGEDDKVKGVDIPAPFFSFTETHAFRPSEYTPKYQAILAYFTGAINQKPFRGFQPGEVMFAGADGNRSGDDSTSFWYITFEFIVKSNEENKDVGGVTVAEKRGWDIMWVKTNTEADSGYTKPGVKGVYINRPHTIKDFAQLGIGVN